MHLRLGVLLPRCLAGTTVSCAMRCVESWTVFLQKLIPRTEVREAAAGGGGRSKRDDEAMAAPLPSDAICVEF